MNAQAEVCDFDPSPVTPGSVWLGRGSACPRYAYMVLRVIDGVVFYRAESGIEHCMPLKDFEKRLDPARGRR